MNTHVQLLFDLFSLLRLHQHFYILLYAGKGGLQVIFYPLKLIGESVELGKTCQRAVADRQSSVSISL